ncbi:MAG: MFS transporter [Pirellulales bacterium]|nr:MFS transporter [Pirellulales bacterium]
MSNNLQKKGMFTLENGQNLAFTFALVSLLFLLWGLCNGMIDVMDKHFQDELGLTKSESAWVQFAHYLGYFLMALPAGWIAAKLGYKGGIIAGLLMVAAGGFWFVPATTINTWAIEHTYPWVTSTVAFVGYLIGVCAIAAGLTFLETVANPYTTVLGPREFSATRINLAQSCNGIGWILGPIIGGLFFYAKDASGHSIGSEQIYIPYVIVACVVLVLSVIFYFAYIPDVKTKDDYHIEDKDEANGAKAAIERELNRGQIYIFLLLNASVLICIAGIFLWLLLSIFNIGGPLVQIASLIPLPFDVKVTPDNSLLIVIFELACVLLAVSVFALIPVTNKVTHHSIWSHPHFSGSVLSQFLYVAAQAGIFSFFINYMTSEVPRLPQSMHVEMSKPAIDERIAKGELNSIRGFYLKKAKDWFEINTAFAAEDIEDFPEMAERIKRGADPVSAYLKKNFSESAVKEFNAYEGGISRSLRSILVQELNLIVRQNPLKAKDGIAFYNPDNFTGIALSPKTKELLDQKLQEDAEAEKIKAAEKDMTKEQKLEAAKNRAEMEGKVEKVNSPMLNRLLLQDAYPDLLDYRPNILCISEQGAAFLLSIGFICFLIGRFSGAAMLRKVSAHKILGLYGLMNVVMCLLIFAKWGWLSVICVFLSFFFMSIMFPTIFALGIFGLGSRAKKASAFLVMAIMGGAVLPKLMGYVADQYDMSRGFIVPLGCFAVIALYGFLWPKFSGATSLSGLDTSKGH